MTTVYVSDTAAITGVRLGVCFSQSVLDHLRSVALRVGKTLYERGRGYNVIAIYLEGYGVSTPPPRPPRKPLPLLVKKGPLPHGCAALPVCVVDLGIVAALLGKALQEVCVFLHFRP